jgi:hypothetical protein
LIPRSSGESIRHRERKRTIRHVPYETTPEISTVFRAFLFLVPNAVELGTGKTETRLLAFAVLSLIRERRVGYLEKKMEDKIMSEKTLTLFIALVAVVYAVVDAMIIALEGWNIF